MGNSYTQTLAYKHEVIYSPYTIAKGMVITLYGIVLENLVAAI